MKNWIFAVTLIALSLQLPAQSTAIIPQPVQVEWKQGHFLIDKETTIVYEQTNKDLTAAARMLSVHIEKISGLKLKEAASGNTPILLSIRPIADLGKEGYRLEISPEAIQITAAGKQGIVYALQSLMQMLPAVRTNEPLKLPCVSIFDFPSFAWRGVLLDVCRHYFSPELIKQFIDLLSFYKMNTLHWHLTDDQGWRIEIKKYPELTRTGAWRVDHTKKVWGDRPQALKGEPPTYGGYYTQEQIREIIQYASTRGVRIVPEIEMPGHSAAAIASLPWLSCRQQTQLPMTGGNYNGIASSYCAGNDSVFRFLENVLSEVIELFPSEYIHIGGDELDKTPWLQCAKCQNRIRTENLKNEEELQSYFIRRIEKFVNTKGRKIIGWDEILEGGLAPGAAVMSWRGESGGIAAAKMQHNVVMTPGNPLYIDNYQGDPSTEPLAIGGFNTLKKVYDYHPIPDALSEGEKKYILGAQANLWTEFITTPLHATYMLLPRMLALAEGVWTPKADKEWAGFNKRLQSHFKRWDQQGILYSKGNFRPAIHPYAENGQLFASLSTEIYAGQILYSLNGSEPNVQSPVYTRPIKIDSSVLLQAVTVVDGKLMPGHPASQQFSMHQGLGKKVTYLFPENPSYAADGPNTLTDGIKGTDMIGKYWHGFYNVDLVATVDLQRIQNIKEIALGCMQKYRDWIFLPREVRYEVSTDGINYEQAAVINNDVPATETTVLMKKFTASIISTPARYVRVTARIIDGCPQGHPGAGRPAWIFADEIEIH